MSLPDSQLQNILEQINQCIMLVDKKGQIIYANDACEKLLGRSLEQIKHRPATDFLTDESEELRHLIGRKAEKRTPEEENHTRSRLFELQTKESGPVSIGLTAHSFEAPATEADVLLELGIRHRASYLQKVSDQLPGVLYEVEDLGDNLKFTFTSDGYEAFAGPEASLTYPQSMEDIHPEDRDELEEKMFSAIENRDSFQAEYRYLQDDGTVVWARAQSEPYQKSDGTYAWIGVIIDITELKKTQESLEQALEEKETLLQEVHHRVKNNMDIISSMLKLQLKTVGNPELEKLLQECLNRIQSMALVHRMLHEGKQPGHLNLKSYGNRIVERIWTAYEPTEIDVGREVRFDDVPIEHDLAIPCGLILNELISNALLHAFEDRSRGHVDIRLVREENHYELSVSDDGIGLPDEFDPVDSGHLGYRLVRSLVRNNLQGEMEIKMNEGTTVHICFPVQQT